MRLIGDKLVCERGGRQVFASLDFTVGAGELLVLKGPNGAGKTSLLRMIAGLNEPVSGRLQLEGGNAELTIGQHCHFIAHQDALKPALTVAENLEFWGNFLGGGEVAGALGDADDGPSRNRRPHYRCNPCGDRGQAAPAARLRKAGGRGMTVLGALLRRDLVLALRQGGG